MGIKLKKRINAVLPSTNKALRRFLVSLTILNASSTYQVQAATTTTTSTTTTAASATTTAPSTTTTATGAAQSSITVDKVQGDYDLKGISQTFSDLSGSGTIQSSGSNAQLTLLVKIGWPFQGTLASTLSNVNINGPQTLILYGKNDAALTTVNPGGSLEIRGTTTGNIINNSALSFYLTKPLTYGGTISGTGTVRPYGSGTLTLSESNNYTGKTIIEANTTLVGNITTSVGVSLTGTYDLKGTARTLVDPSGTGTIQSSNTPAALTITSQNGSIFSGTLANNLSGLAINGAGTFTLSSTTTYPGPVTVSSGTLALTNTTALSGTVNLSQDTTLSVKATGTPTVANTITFGSAATITVSQPTTFSGPVTCTASGGVLTVKGGYPVTFAGTQTGVFTIVAADKNSSVINANTNDLNGTARTIIDPSGSGTIKSSGTPAALTINATKDADFLGVIDNTINGLTLTGSGKFGFTKDQTYTGTTTINSGAYLQVSASGTTGSIASTNVVNNGKISFTRSNPYTYAGVISGTGTLHQYKLNTLTLTGANTYTGATTIDAGGTLIGDISKSVGVEINGTYDLNGTARTLISATGAGTIQSSNTPAVLTLTPSVGKPVSFSGTLATSISGIIASGSADNVRLQPSNLYAGLITVNSGASFVIGGTSSASQGLSGNITNNSGVHFYVSSDYTYPGVISGAGFVKIATGTSVTLSGANTYTGTTTIASGLTLIGDISKSVGVEITGTYDLNGIARTLINPSGTGTIKSSGTPAALTITSQNDSTFSGTLVSTLSDLTKNGAGTLTLSNTTPYAGPVTVSSGTLALTNSSSLSGTIKLSQNATLAIKALSTTATGTTATGTTATGTTATGTVVITSPITFGSDATGTNPTVTLNVSQPTTFSGAITCNAPSGTTVTLAITGGYPVTFTGTQTGTFKIAPSGANSSVVTPGYTLGANNSITYTTPSNISDSLSAYTNVSIDLPLPTDTFIFTYQKNYTGTLTVKKGTLQVGTGGSSITIPNTNIVNNGAINFTRSSDFTYAGIISGTGSFKKSTSSKLTLTSPSTYTGATTIDAGCTIAGGIGSSVGVSIAGTYDLNGAQQTLIDPSGAGTIQSSGTNAVLTITSQKGSTFTGTLATSLSGLTINGTGTFTLSNTTAYTGAVTVSSGTLALTKSSSLSGAINLARNTTLAIKTENITATGTTATGTTATGTTATGTTATGTTATGTTATGTTATGTIITNPISFGSDATGTNTTVTLNVSQPTTFSGPITCSAPSGTTVTLAVTGGYPVTFTGAQIGAFKIVPSGSNTSVNDNGVYDLKGTAQTFVDPAGDNAIKSSGKNADLTITTQNGSTFSGTIENSISKLTVNGSKILTLSSASTYTGAIIINAQSSLIGNISNTTSITVDGTYDLNGTAQTLNNLSGSGTIKSSNSKAALTLISQNDSTFSGIFDNNLSSVVKSGPGTLTLASATCYTGEIIVSEGTLSLTKASALSGNIKLSQKAILSTNVTEESTFANPISFGSTTVSSPTATINVSKPTTFSGAITCNAAPGTTGALIISGGYPVTLTGKHTGTFAIILSGKGTSLIVKDDANTNTEVLSGSTWFLLNK